MASEPLSIALGGMVWRIDSHGVTTPSIQSAYSSFLDESPPTQQLTISSGNGFPRKEGRPLFETDAAWTLYKTGSGYLLKMPADATQRPLQQWASFSRDFQQAELVIQDKKRDFDAYMYPFDQLWAMHLLAGQGGLLCHGCAVVYEGRGFLFLGHSGGGKTTMARLWATIPGATVLSDERVIIRCHSDRDLLYGTPWHGEGGFAAAGSVPLERIFILSHGDANRLNPLTGASSASALLTRSLVPFWHQELLTRSLGTVTALCGRMTVDELEFFPDQRIISYLQGLRSPIRLSC